MYNLKNAIQLLVKVYHKRHYIMGNVFDTFTKLDDFECKYYAGCIIAKCDNSGMMVTVMRPRQNYKNSGIDIYLDDNYFPTSFFYRKDNDVIFQSGTQHLFDINSTTDDHFNAMIDDDLPFSLDDIIFGIKQFEQIRTTCTITYKKI
ncbi:hypothetical protein XaC1_114 [Xanthomonas phage XaC1]|nr:hypothetical protein XaC1_114 [Xanthomonas phage XaC1]